MTKTTLTTIASISGVAALISGCTGQIPGSFRLEQQNQTFAANIQIDTKVDLLWVVDNSSSMDIEQENLRQGLAGFASTYMQPTWDIQVAVITTDTYLANTQYSNFLSEVIPGTVGWKSNYIAGRTAGWVNPSWNTNLLNPTTFTFPNGVTYNDLVPAWGANYAKLQAGNHDGPIQAFCFEGQSYFLDGVTNCAIRDSNPSAYSGVGDCLNPTGSETSVTQCLNTIENNTVHSGSPIIATMPTTALTGTALTDWTTQIANNFIINATTGSAGHGSERGMQSVMQMINDNELGTGTTPLFRAGSVRGLIFLSDEDDQTMYPETSVASSFTPFSHYACDQPTLAANNPSSVTSADGFCCTGGTCTFGATIPANTSFPDGTTSGSSGMTQTNCPSKTVDSYTYTISVCPNTHYLVPVSTIKTGLDSFFLNLDGNTSTNPNYFVTAITPLLGTTIESIQSSRHTDDSAAGYPYNFATDRGDRYIALANLVGGYSNTYDIGAGTTDYSPILSSIGNAIISQKSTFTLTRAPTNQEEMIVTLVHANGTSQVIPASEYTISGNEIIITDQALVLSFSSTDTIAINYQPKTVN
jgi:hypothetical protein